MNADIASAAVTAIGVACVILLVAYNLGRVEGRTVYEDALRRHYFPRARPTGGDKAVRTFSRPSRASS